MHRYEHLLTADKGTPEYNPVKKWENSDKTSRALAVKAKCAQCFGCTAEWMEPGFRDDIKNCTDKSCTLFNFRPYK